MIIFDGTGKPYDNVPHLIATIERGVEPSRTEAITEALELADPRTIPVVTGEIRAGRLSARHLSRFGSAAASTLIELLGDRRPIVRRHAAEVLAENPQAAAESALVRCASDPVFVVRWSAARALQGLKGRSPGWKRIRKSLQIGRYLDRDWLREQPFCFKCGAPMTPHGEPSVTPGLADFLGGRGEAEATFPVAGSFDGSYCVACEMLYCERCSRSGKCGFCGMTLSSDAISGDQKLRGVARNTLHRFA